MVAGITADRLVIIFTLALLGAVACVGSGGSSTTPTPLTQVNCEPLTTFDRYRYASVVTFDLEERGPDMEPETPDLGPSAYKITFDIDGAVEPPDRIGAVVSYPVGSGGNLPIIGIGNVTWTQVVGVWSRDDLPPPELYPAAKMCAGLAPDVDLSGLEGEPDEINGIPVVHYRFDDLPSQFPAAIWSLGSDFARLIDTLDVELWLAQDGGYPVRQDVRGVGHYENGRALVVEAFTEVRDINDKSIKIEPPQ